MLVEIMKIGKEERVCVSSMDVAETFGKRHDNVLADIRAIQSSINSTEFSGLFTQETYMAGNGKRNPLFVMNRDGFTLLVMGYNGEAAMQFKLAYIRQFNAMETALRDKLIERQKGIAVRQALTKALQQSTENDRMHGHAYSTYTNSIYKVLFGLNAKQLREKYGISATEDLRDCFSFEELAAVQSMECLVSGLVACGWNYSAIKTFISQNHTKHIAA